MTVSKRVAKSGAVTLPRQLRQETDIIELDGYEYD